MHIKCIHKSILNVSKHKTIIPTIYNQDKQIDKKNINYYNNLITTKGKLRCLLSNEVIINCIPVVDTRCMLSNEVIYKSNRV